MSSRIARRSAFSVLEIELCMSFSFAKKATFGEKRGSQSKPNFVATTAEAERRATDPSGSQHEFAARMAQIDLPKCVANVRKSENSGDRHFQFLSCDEV